MSSSQCERKWVDGRSGWVWRTLPQGDVLLSPPALAPRGGGGGRRFLPGRVEMWGGGLPLGSKEGVRVAAVLPDLQELHATAFLDSSVHHTQKS